MRTRFITNVRAVRKMLDTAKLAYSDLRYMEVHGRKMFQVRLDTKQLGYKTPSDAIAYVDIKRFWNFTSMMQDNRVVVSFDVHALGILEQLLANAFGVMPPIDPLPSMILQRKDGERSS